MIPQGEFRTLRNFAELQDGYSIAVRTAASRHADMGRSLLKQLELVPNWINSSPEQTASNGPKKASW
ncbi:hypothetical protein Ct61P_15129 [Colletotrichum tofieldiae]|nr:hypothetical protein Ct61P_15129 [Colletotrichum tofieldiae]